jgi:O-antigen ligase
MLALLIAAIVAVNVLLLTRVSFAELGALSRSGVPGVALILNWVVTLIAGPYAAVQLLRLRNSGRFAGAVVFAVTAVYHALSALLLRQPGEVWLPTVLIALLVGAPAALLLTRAAKRVCE